MNSKTYHLPDFATQDLERAYDEIELLGFPVTTSMFDLLQTSFRGDVPVSKLVDHIGETVRKVGDFVDAKCRRLPGFSTLSTLIKAFAAKRGRFVFDKRQDGGRFWVSKHGGGADGEIAGEGGSEECLILLA